LIWGRNGYGQVSITVWGEEVLVAKHPAAEHHQKAADKHKEAEQSHRKAAEQHEAGDPDHASTHADEAHKHGAEATQHAQRAKDAYGAGQHPTRTDLPPEASGLEQNADARSKR
jgi:hypothetical protein